MSRASSFLAITTYLSLILQFLSLKEVVQIIVISKFHSKFLNNKKRKALVKKLVTYEYGNIWSIYNINLPYGQLTNLQFTKKLFTQFEFVKTVSKIQSNEILWTLNLIPILGPLGNYKIIKYWSDKLKLDRDEVLVFVYVSENYEWSIVELIKLLYNITIYRIMLHNNCKRKISFLFYNEYIKVSKQKKITNGIIALLYRIKDCVLKENRQSIVFIYNTFVILLFGQYLDYVSIELKDYTKISEYSDNKKLLLYLQNNEVRILNLKYILQKILKLTTIEIFGEYLKYNGHFTQSMKIALLTNTKTKAIVDDILLECIKFV